MTNTAIPSYVYQDPCSRNSLSQGDILKVDGQFREYFEEFYPKIIYRENKDRYVMVLTQSCDLVKTHKRQPKLTHINVCLVKSLQYIVQKLAVDEINPLLIGDKKILQKNAIDQLKDKLFKLLNNSDQKIYFFLPKQAPFTEDMVAILPLSFSFRVNHYDLLVQNRVLELKPEFQAKVGHTISQLYGRIGTPDLLEFGWDDKKIRNYIKELLHNLNLVQVPDKGFIDYIQSHFTEAKSNVEELIQDYQTIKNDNLLKPLQNEITKNIRTCLLKLFEDKKRINFLTQMDKPVLSKEIGSILQMALKNSE